MNTWHLARGYRFAGVHCGLRPDPDRRDLALVVSDAPAAAAGAFTQNRVRAAPVRVCQERLPADDVYGVVVCSGNANACTGQQGMADARRMTAVAAEAVGCRPEQMLVCSTGVIGRPLPMPVIEPGIRAAADHLMDTPEALDATARAILTTDTRIKVVTQAVLVGGVEVRLTGVAKGAAMIGPNLATMLAFVFTDAAVGADDLAPLAAARRRPVVQLRQRRGPHQHQRHAAAVRQRPGRRRPLAWRRIWASVSTARPWTAFVANWLAGFHRRRRRGCDAPGASIDVGGTRDDAPRQTQGGEGGGGERSGEDGRVRRRPQLGPYRFRGGLRRRGVRGGAPFPLARRHLLLYHAGTPQPFDSAPRLSAYLKPASGPFTCVFSFTLGAGRCTFWTCDLTHEYIRLNAEYTT